ncbi:MAG: cell division protein ZipA [Proteobacteria bacterium]|nr:cell division protein ZipA [Pseudomonadota bacterium]
MDMDPQTLRLALFAIGIIIVVVVLFIGGSDKRRQKNIKRRLEKKQYDAAGNTAVDIAAEEDSDGDADEVGMQQELEALKGMGAMIAADKQDGNPEQELEEELQISELTTSGLKAEKSGQEKAEIKTTEEKPTVKGPRPDMVVTLYLQSLGKKRVHGTALLEATVKTGLVYGKMKLFHRVPEGSTQSLFSLANGLKPGTFDPTAWNLFETPMLTLFFSLPAPFEGLATFESMLATANRLADLLDLAILDNKQMPLNRERIAEIREELRSYDRKHLK